MFSGCSEHTVNIQGFLQQEDHFTRLALKSTPNCKPLARTLFQQKTFKSDLNSSEMGQHFDEYER